MFEANSYGFRPGRSCHDAIGQCYTKLNKGISGGHIWVLDADIKGFFDNIVHESILKMTNSLPSNELVKEWLKPTFRTTKCNTERLQGKVVEKRKMEEKMLN